MAIRTAGRRYRLKLTAGELDRFFNALAETGNVTLAAERVGRHRSTFVKRCGRDPAFAARCGAAVARFRLGVRSKAPPAPAAGDRPLKCAPGELVFTHGRKRPGQLRRAGGGELSEAGVAAFLQTLAATANLRLAADSVGVWPNAIHRRRQRDPAFDRAVREALMLGYDRVEAALIESACRALETDDEHEDWLAANGGAALPKMDVDQAMMLFAQHRRTCRLGWESRRQERQSASWEEVERYFKRALRMAKSGASGAASGEG